MKLLVGYDGGAVGPMEIVAGLRGLAEPVFLVPEAMRRHRLGEVVGGLAETLTFADAGGEGRLEPSELDRVAGHRRIDGALTFSERMLEAISQVTTRLGLPGHDSGTLRMLTDKHAQRCALRESGVDPVRFLLLDSVDSLSTTLVDTVGFPAILKPVRGHGSRNTYLVTEPRALSDLVHRLLVPPTPRGEPAERRLLLEEYLAGDAQQVLGDYVSVESVISDCAVKHWAITGKFHQLSDFREVGDFWPAALPERTAADVERLVTAALGVLGVRTGVTHTEVKLTSDGPRIIEVNGRLGGDVNALARAAYELDVVELAARNALGLPVRLPPAKLSRVYYNISVSAPPGARRLRAVAGIDTIRQLPTVCSYRRYLGVGSELVSREAACGLGLVTGWAADHAGLLPAIQQVLSKLYYEFDWHDGGIVTRSGWQLTLGEDRDAAAYEPR